MTRRVLLVDDNRSLLEGMAETLLQEELSVCLCDTAGEAIGRLEKERFPVVVTDIKLPDMSGVELLRDIRRRYPETVVILITAYATVDLAVEAMKTGAFDFMTKPFNADEIALRVRKAMEKYELQERVQLLSHNARALREDSMTQFDPSDIVGRSLGMQEVKTNIDRLARSRSAVLILGETGTGKELVARGIHYRSARCDGPFVRVNSAVFADTLIESELFGHEKGAFTGAHSRKPGRFELADKGTIFLDEVAELSPAAQGKLLRVLQEHEFERVGGAESIRVDVRVIAATNRVLAREVEVGRFREDLYYRLNVVPIEVPPLRRRKGDIPELVAYFLARYCRENHKQIRRFGTEAMDVLMAHDWPGNVRELENVVERGVVLSDGDVIGVEALPFPVSENGSRTAALNEKVDLYERDLIKDALERSNKNTSKAASLLGISRSTLRYKIQKYF